MRFDPKAPPFWEQARGHGPVTTWQRSHEKAMARQRSDELEEKILRLEAELSAEKAENHSSRAAQIKLKIKNAEHELEKIRIGT